MARSSDQRYFQARRTKRKPNLFPEIADAISMAKQNPSMAPIVYHLARASSVEFTHIMLACGRTAHDFRRNFRRGSAGHNTIPATDLVPYDDLRPAKLDGYVCFRLTREQYWNVKTRAGKVRIQDAVVHDPQGQWWSLLLHYMLKGPSVEHLGLLIDFQKWKVKLLDPEREEDCLKLYTKLSERHERYLASAEPDFPEREAEVSGKLIDVHLEALQKWVALLDEAKGLDKLVPQIRLEIEKSLVVIEAFVTGGDVQKAALDPDTSGRHCSLSALTKRLAKCASFFDAREGACEDI